jgi:hypothetical protein
MFISGTKPNSLPSSANANTQIYPVDLSSVLTSYGLSKTTQGASFKETQFRKPWENNHNGNIWWIYDRIEGACEI